MMGMARRVRPALELGTSIVSQRVQSRKGGFSSVLLSANLKEKLTRARVN